jgi:AbiV family abortive infection protein
MLTPTTARAFWLALLENAARIIIDADALFPSPRAQSLIVLAQEEVGKAVWVAKSFRDAWYHGHETPHEVPELSKKAANHLAKLIAAADFGTMFVEVPGNTEPVELELVKTHAPEVLDAYLKRLAREDNEAKMSGFYVDLRADGTFTVPHAIERPLLRAQIWETADMIQWFLSEDHLFANMTGNPVSSTKEVKSLLIAVLAHGPGDGL